MGVLMGGRFDYRFGIEDMSGCVLSIRNESTFMSLMFIGPCIILIVEER